MGRIVAPYGIQGWLKVQPDTETLDSLFDYLDWWLGREDGLRKSAWQKYRVETVKIHVNILLVKLQGIDDRDAALAVKGKHIAVPREQLPKAGKDEYYWSDLIGLKVTNQQQVDLGEITDVFATGANDVMVVKAERERLLPFIDQVVLEVDLEAKTMLVDWPAEWGS
jgi:16S rRNA processing protein RimM